MVWWMVAVLVVVPLLVLGAALAGLGRRRAELERVAALVQESLTAAAAPVRAKLPELAARLAGLEARTAELRERMLLVRAGRGARG